MQLYYNGTVTTAPIAYYTINYTTPPYLPFFPLLDKLLAAILALGACIGIPANLLALTYFLTKPAPGDIATLLYTIICILDMCTCALQLPVAHTLLRGRDPGLFNSHIFCEIWVVGFHFNTGCSMFLVMLLSVTRAISIKLPFHQTRRRTVVASIGVYILLLLSRDVVDLLNGRHSWIRSTVFCAAWEAQAPWKGISNVTVTLQTALPSVIITVSFLVGNTFYYLFR